MGKYQTIHLFGITSLKIKIISDGIRHKVIDSESGIEIENIASMKLYIDCDRSYVTIVINNPTVDVISDDPIIVRNDTYDIPY